MDRRTLFLFALTAFLYGCSSDDMGRGEGTELLGVQGTVLQTVACQTQNNGLAYEIRIVNNPELPDRIITASLPDEFKQDNLDIRFDMQNSQEGFGACVDLYGPDDFYRIYNVTLNPSTP